MAELKMLAIDLGASSSRGIVGSFDGEHLSLRENHRFSNDPVITNGRMLSDPLINDDSRAFNFTNEGGAMRTIRFLKNIMGLWLIQESRRQWKREGNEYSFAQMETWSRECRPLHCLIDPDDASFATPGNMPERIREYCRRIGQHVPESVGEVVRCIYESLALKYRKTAEWIQGLMGRQAKVIHVVGGGTKDQFLSQMTADACGVPVVAGPEEATAIGNLIMQAIAAGAVSNLAQARQSFPRLLNSSIMSLRSKEKCGMRHTHVFAHSTDKK